MINPHDISRRIALSLSQPRCEQCNCTELRACLGGCHWDQTFANMGRFLCSACAEQIDVPPVFIRQGSQWARELEASARADERHVIANELAGWGEAMIVDGSAGGPQHGCVLRGVSYWVREGRKPPARSRVDASRSGGRKAPDRLSTRQSRLTSTAPSCDPWPEPRRHARLRKLTIDRAAARMVVTSLERKALLRLGPQGTVRGLEKSEKSEARKPARRKAAGGNPTGPKGRT